MQRILFLTFLVLIFSVQSRAQVLDLYSRITDPRGIARLDNVDSTPTIASCFHGDAKWNIDSSDMSGIVAQDTGSGVITHIWSTSGTGDSLITMKLYIDDTLFLADHYFSFFKTLSGILRPPLDTFANGAFTWDVQIPFHHGFKWTLKTNDPNLYYAVMWHHVDGAVLPWLPLKTINTTFGTQPNAELRIRSEESPWHDTNAIVLQRVDTLRSGTLALQTIKGPGMLQVLRFRSSSYDVGVLDSAWLNLYWDHSPQPSMHVPLKDFFLCPTTVTKVRAFQLHADPDSGFISYFPMPFFDEARIELVRTGTQPLVLSSFVQYDTEKIDRNKYGYFHADFSESNPTRYHVWHPVLHTVGRGRYVGMSFGVMGHPYAVFLEGDPEFEADSNQKYYIRYTGGEDYFDAAWWFSNGIYSLPFSGYTHWIDQFYRFQYLDCFEFEHSFDFDLQPGGNTDVYDHYRTIAYYYKHWTPFWANRDTIKAGETWEISGADYPPQTNLAIQLGPYSFSSFSDRSGRFHLNLTVPPFWKPGAYSLSVNGESAPQKYYVIGGPAIRTITDTLPITLRAGDSLSVRGTGFLPGERVDFYLDSIPMGQHCIADSMNSITTQLRIAYLPDRSYLLVARGALSGNATAEQRVTITRTMFLEFEDMIPPLEKTPGLCWAENVSYYWNARWSKQMFVYFKPDTIFAGARLKFAFTIGHADTFAIDFHNSLSRNLGRYSIAIDTTEVGVNDGCLLSGGWDPVPSGAIKCGTHYLAEGMHTITFTCLGKNDSAKNYWIEPDVLVLTPTTYMPPAPGTILPGTLDTNPSPDTIRKARSLVVSPNPVSGSTLEVSLDLSDGESIAAGGVSAITVFDELGRKWDVPFTSVMEGDALRATVPVSGLPSGVYYVVASIRRSNGGSFDTPRVAFIRE